MKHYQFESWLDLGQPDFYQSQEGESCVIDHDGPTPNSLHHHQDPLQPTQILSQLPLSDPKLKMGRQKTLWTSSETQFMLQLHNELGNRWAILSKKIPGKSENDIKNHFFCQLRKSLRCLNKLLLKPHLKKQQTIKPLILFKISNMCQEQFHKDSKVSSDLIQQAIRIKQNLFNFLELSDEIKKENSQQLAKEIKLFIAKTRKGCKGRGKNATQKSLLSQCNSESESPSTKHENKKVSFEQEREEIGQLKEQIILPEDSNKLIVRPSFDLENPLEQFELEFSNKHSWEKEMRPLEFAFSPQGDSCLSHFLFPSEFNSYEL